MSRVVEPSALNLVEKATANHETIRPLGFRRAER